LHRTNITFHPHTWHHKRKDEALGLAGRDRGDGVAEDVLFSWSEDQHVSRVPWPLLAGLMV
jgi:hypothetical protein